MHLSLPGVTSEVKQLTNRDNSSLSYSSSCLYEYYLTMHWLTYLFLVCFLPQDKKKRCNSLLTVMLTFNVHVLIKAGLLPRTCATLISPSKYPVAKETFLCEDQLSCGKEESLRITKGLGMKGLFRSSGSSLQHITFEFSRLFHGKQTKGAEDRRKTEKYFFSSLSCPFSFSSQIPPTWCSHGTSFAQSQIPTWGNLYCFFSYTFRKKPLHQYFHHFKILALFLTSNVRCCFSPVRWLLTQLLRFFWVQKSSRQRMYHCRQELKDILPRWGHQPKPLANHTALYAEFIWT